MSEWVQAPPGSTAKKLPADVLALLDLIPYMSTACQTAHAIEQVIPWNTHRKDLPVWAARMHGQCRTNNKFTDEKCYCLCGHVKEQAPGEKELEA